MNGGQSAEEAVFDFSGPQASNSLVRIIVTGVTGMKGRA